MPIGKVWIYCLLFAFSLFVFLVYVYGFLQDKASGVKFCMVVHLRPVQGLYNFGELRSPRSPKMG